METEWKTNTSRFALVRRKIATLITARRVHRSVEKLKKNQQKRSLTDAEREREWDELHKKNAQLACRHIMKYRGFLTKVGQSASTRAGELPGAWVEAMTPLQDQLPVSSFKDVKQTFRSDLGRSIDDVFNEFQERPIASASVAQAHIARLKSTGKKVCVKVQHKGVAKVMGADLSAIEYLCKKAAQYHPDAPDLTNFVRDWRRASREEVDFRLEAQYAIRAQTALHERAKMNVACPAPILDYCSRKVLTMDFIDGWKITQAHLWPPQIDRQDIANRLVEAFGYLTFQEGLIHGDPHPANVFVELTSDDPKSARPVLLDWGLVQNVSETERLALARWAVGALSQDRVLYLSALRDLGFSFTDDFEEADLDEWLDTATWTLRDSISSSAQLRFNDQMTRQRAEAAALMGDKKKKTVWSVPGNVLFFLRGLKMLQDICGRLDVTVPFARVVLIHALPLLEAPGTRQPRMPLPAPRQCPDMELAVRNKLEELRCAGLILGAQVAVFANDGSWPCNIAIGRAGILAEPLEEDHLMPLLDVGIGVLLACLMRELWKRNINLDSPIASYWPGFSERGKRGITFKHILQHQAGILRPFPRELTLKGYCSEDHMEEVIASSPCLRNGSGSPCPCRVLGFVAAALLRRVMGHKTIIDALSASLKPLKLQGDIAYNTEIERMARLGRKPLGQLSMSRIMSWFEDRQTKLSLQKHKVQWYTWAEFVSSMPNCADSLVVNRNELLTGKGCISGRGLRGTAKAVCRLYAAVGGNACKGPGDKVGRLPLEYRESDSSHRAKLTPTSVDEWDDLGRCIDIGLGWQAFRFRSPDGSKELWGYGHSDGATGSIALHIGGVSIAILLNAVDENCRQTGQELLDVIALHLGLVPMWLGEVPEGLAADIAARQGHPVDDEPKPLEAKPASMAVDVKPRKGKKGRSENSSSSSPTVPATLDDIHSLSGRWNSAESDGLDDLLDRFEVPAVAQGIIRKMERMMRIEVRSPVVSISTTTIIAGRVIEQTTSKFTIGEVFRAEQELGGSYQGLATWGLESDSQSTFSLKIEKRFGPETGGAAMVEFYSVNDSGRLSHRSILRGPGQCKFKISTPAELSNLCQSLCPDTLRLKQNVNVAGECVVKGGRLVAPQSDQSLNSLRDMKLPGNITLQYDDVQCTTMFDRVGRAVSRPAQKPETTETFTSRSLKLGAKYCGICCETSVDITRTVVAPACAAGVTLVSKLLYDCAAHSYKLLAQKLQEGRGEGQQTTQDTARSNVSNVGNPIAGIASEQPKLRSRPKKTGAPIGSTISEQTGLRARSTKAGAPIGDTVTEQPLEHTRSMSSNWV